jgi:hypothetical protein
MSKCKNQHQNKEKDSQKSNWLYKLCLPVAGLLSVLWLLIRVIPKPSRAYYPCMKVAVPIASTFIVYILGFLTSIIAFRKAKNQLGKAQYVIAGCFIVLFITAGFIGFSQNSRDSYAAFDTLVDPLGPNNPIGDAKGVLPGRVVWVHDPDSTNENCQPTVWGNGYYLDKNCNQSVVDDMFSKAIKELTEKASDAEAWDAIFRNFNQTHDKGNVPYSKREKIFIKVNAVHTNTRNFGPDGEILDSKQLGAVDTSPHAIMTLLRQLVNEAGIPQKYIYIGDPMYRHFFKHSYDKFSAEFPKINYMSRSGLPGRTKPKESRKVGIHFSDRGSVLDVTTDHYYRCLMRADYIINVPAMKGHDLGGVTFFAKNHFGSHTLKTAVHLHKGLHSPSGINTARFGYNKYRIFVDLMGGENVGGKTLLYYMDGLWSTSEAHLPAAKYLSEPFNNDWSSSIFLSLDPVAISSVCLDVMKKEFKVEDLDAEPPRHTHVHFPGLDDFLHQAASSDWWPEGLVYDPENDGTPLTSLGVHEHWNNETDMEYSRNLGTGDGIELIKLF